MKTLLNRLTIKGRVVGLEIFNLTVSVIILTTSYIIISGLGTEIKAIGHQDIPFMEAITSIEIHQLEQEIALERALRFAGVATEDERKQVYLEEKKHFLELAKKVDAEFKSVEAQLKEGIAKASNEEARQKFQSLLTQIEKIDHEHQVFDDNSVKIFSVIDRGDIVQAAEAAKGLMILVKQIEEELVAALKEISTFTEDAILTAEDHEEHGMIILLSIAAGAMVIGLMISFGILNSVLKPLMRMQGQMKELSMGNLNVEIPDHPSRDEMTSMVTALQSFKENAIEKARLDAEAKTAQEQRLERSKKIEALIAKFEKEVGQIVAVVSSAATELSSSAESMTKLVTDTSKQSSEIAANSNQTLMNVQAVAASAEEMSVSVKEISQQIVKSTTVVKETVERNNSANLSAQSLSEASQEVSKIAELIEGIAGQINLLALNATIESARAGEAGKGFAVVANEVKALANQTTNATNEIGDRISSIQAAANIVKDAIGLISESVERVNQYTSAIAAAVEEQTAVTDEIAKNMNNASAGVSQISDNIGTISQSAQHSSTAASQVLSAAQELSKQSEKMREEVSVFLAGIRAA